MDKENATVDVAGALAEIHRKSRSKSIGPGGLDALKHANGNRRAVMALRTEEEQQAAAREREERERRDARRKSLANRRVSFAAEATLHTFHEVEYMPDSTTSTDDSFRRASSVNGSDISRSASKAADDENAPRRNSGLPALNFHNVDDATLTSTIYSSDSEPADAVEEVEDDSGSSSDSDDGTMMTIETEEVTGTTFASERYGSDDESSTLDQALRAAAERAGTQRLGSDPEEDEELDEGEEIIPSFGWVKKNNSSVSAGETEPSLPTEDDGTEMDMGMDMEMTSAVGRILRPQQHTMDNTRDGEMSMDVTQALGGIVSEDKTRRDAPGPLVAGENCKDDASMEATMEFTTALGGIHQPQKMQQDGEFDTNEDFSMEFTTALGGVLSQSKEVEASTSRRQTLSRLGEADITMDMTVAYGNILAQNSPQKDSKIMEEETFGMDITAAIGGILGNGLVPSSPSPGHKMMKERGRKSLNPDRIAMAAVAQQTPTRRSSRLSAISQAAAASAASEMKDDSRNSHVELPALRGEDLRRSHEPQTPDTISSPLRTPTSSPPKLTKSRALTDSFGTPSQRRRTQRKSPRSVTKIQSTGSAHAEKKVSPPESLNPRCSLFQSDSETGTRTPTVIMTPQTRRLSGYGADKSGLGSRQVTELFDRRSSIGDSATKFIPGRQAVSFDDPKAVEGEVDKDRKHDEAKESPHLFSSAKAAALQQPDKDATFNLREMINSLSPRRNALRGRKSLHVGSAKGLLGKRPAELDEDEDSDDNDGVKRLKGHKGSPVKNIKLQQPPSAAETTGKLNRASPSRLEPNASNLLSSSSSPLKNGTNITPHKREERIGILGQNPTVQEVNFYHNQGIKKAEEPDQNLDDGRIHLQDFLNMTSIRFMELTTTKRRHTVAPNSLQDQSTVEGEDGMSLERFVVAGACTVPMLELYQHSCRELKNYIAEGRRIVKEIEAETLEDNPPLFREYVTATPNVKALMDNQFKNVKTYARLLSKAMWYEWRMKLQEGLKEGLVKISEDMDRDERMLKEREDILAAVLPDAVAYHDALEREREVLEEAARELADCDPAELQAARDELTNCDAGIEVKQRLIAEMRQQLQSAASIAEDLGAKKENLVREIEQHEEVREACRGWTCSEVEALKARVDVLEKQHGWAVTGLTGSNLSMAYRREIEIVFDIASFQPHQPNSPIDLWYIGDSKDGQQSKTAEKEFFLQCIRDHVRALPQSRTKILDLLNMVRAAWDKARFVATQVRAINVTFPTKVVKTSDSSVAVVSSLLLTALRTRVEATLHLHSRSASLGVDVGISAHVSVVYGEPFNVSKVGEFLAAKIGDKIGTKEEGWSDVLIELQKRLTARGKKQVLNAAQ
ncbi:hypothetical protein UVI_02031180 [Ustilaginoidea virens]|uniref:Spc7 kinetochore protein domain-containing protein n=1 Tax=Ustilaginoidea virens TaxID=1159556 RepID=A0A1B5L1C4_USTVR|nr:hypothetical protein UVI_02031180 [Ustilaginoidea virens]